MVNRVLYRFGLLMAVVMIVITTLLIFERVRQLEAVRLGFWDNLAYTTSQTDFELVRLIDALSQSEDTELSDVSDEIFIRFEVALGRLVGLTEGRTGERILSNEEVRAQVFSSIDLLEDLENEILGYASLTRSQQIAVKSSLRDLSADFHRATVTIASLGDRDQSEFYDSLAGAARFEITMILLILGAGTLAFANAFWERQRFRRLNNSLTDMVDERTAELRNSNDLLRSQVVERTRAEERFRSLVEHATEAIVIFDLDNNAFVEVNPRAEALFGAPRKDLIGRVGVNELSPEFQPGGQRSDEAALAYMNEALEGDFPSFEWMHRSVDGEELPCLVSLARFPDETRRFIRGSVIDMRDRKKQEATQVELERKLSQAQKLEAIGQLTGGVAHDFNNLLSVIVGNLELLLETTDDPDARQMIQASINASMKGSELTRSMLNFAGRAPLQPEEVSLVELIGNMDNWISRTIPATIRIEQSVPSDLWPVLADATGTESALLNLVINARDAMPDGGLLSVESENIEVNEAESELMSHGLEPGRYVMLAVSDTGEGIPPELLSKVVEPFYSTKGLSKNSGLGLSMVQGFMEQSGGTLRIYSELGVGTTIKLFFPAISKEISKQKDADNPTEPEPRPGRILVAEDQKDVLSIIKKALEAQGHVVIPAESGDEAAELFKQNQPIDLLITDIVMPGSLQGPTLAMHLRDQMTDLPVVFMSGYASEALLHGNGLRKEDIRLMKPVPKKKLLDAVHQALQSRRRPLD